MSEPIITVENLSKRYRIGMRERDNRSFREVFLDGITAPIRNLRRLHSMTKFMENNHRDDQDQGVAAASEDDVIWALKDVSFEVKEGEVLGVIGSNGAGKSTLLKILSRVTEPTTGDVKIYGRMSSLLEVGTGFHPELTGRENIFLNGAILGMTKKEIEKKFDEIVAFSEVEKFIDTPVKYYSSGMYVRLAFAVAAHLEPEILVVDEVLAVGDAAFQKKCLGKMEDVAKHGRTVLFVSHNMQAIRNLCHIALLLEGGLVSASGLAPDVVERYLRGIPNAETVTSLDTLIRQLPPDPALRWESIVLTQNGRPVADRVLNGQPLEIEIRYQVLERTTGLRVLFDLYDSDGALLFRSFHDEQMDGIPQMQPGHYVSKAVIPADLLSPTKYELAFYATVHNVRWCVPESGIRVSLRVERTGRANRAYLTDPIRGKLAPAIPWATLYL